MTLWQDILDASGLDAPDVDLPVARDLLDGTGHRGETLEAIFNALVQERGTPEFALRGLRQIPGLERLLLPDRYVALKEQEAIEAQGGPVKGIAHHTSQRRGTYSSTWGTPDDLLAMVRASLGPITLDLASSEEHNRRVKAARFETRCPEEPAVSPGDVVWCNPPGPLWNVREFWTRWGSCMRRGAVGAFLIFNADHFRCLAAPEFETVAVFLRRRQKYIGARSSANFSSVLIWHGPGVPEAAGHCLPW